LTVTFVVVLHSIDTVDTFVVYLIYIDETISCGHGSCTVCPSLDGWLRSFVDGCLEVDFGFLVVRFGLLFVTLRLIVIHSCWWPYWWNRLNWLSTFHSLFVFVECIYLTFDSTFILCIDFFHLHLPRLFSFHLRCCYIVLLWVFYVVVVWHLSRCCIFICFINRLLFWSLRFGRWFGLDLHSFIWSHTFIVVTLLHSLLHSLILVHLLCHAHTYLDHYLLHFDVVSYIVHYHSFIPTFILTTTVDSRWPDLLLLPIVTLLWLTIVVTIHLTQYCIYSMCVTRCYCYWLCYTLCCYC